MSQGLKQEQRLSVPIGRTVGRHKASWFWSSGPPEGWPYSDPHTLGVAGPVLTVLVCSPHTSSALRPWAPVPPPPLPGKHQPEPGLGSCQTPVAKVGFQGSGKGDISSQDHGDCWGQSRGKPKSKMNFRGQDWGNWVSSEPAGLEARHELNTRGPGLGAGERVRIPWGRGPLFLSRDCPLWLFCGRYVMGCWLKGRE